MKEKKVGTFTKKRRESARLTENEKRRLRGLRISQKKKQNRKKPVSAQRTIPFKAILKDGICQVTDTYFTKTVEFFDISYQLASNDDKQAVLKKYRDFLNHFDNFVRVQITLLNQQVDVEEYARQIEIQPFEDGFEEIRREYSDMLKGQIAKGNNGIVRRMFLSFGVDAVSLKEAKSRLERVEAGVVGSLKPLGVRVKPIFGLERLKLLHQIFHMDTKQPFTFTYDQIAQSGLSSKDYIAPDGFDFRSDRHFKMGAAYGCVDYIELDATNMDDEMLQDILSLNENLAVNIHFQQMDMQEALKYLRGKLSDVQKMKIEEQKKAYVGNYDMDILPPDIDMYGDNTQDFLDNVQFQDEKVLYVSIVVMSLAISRKKLDNMVFQIAGIVQKHKCRLRRMQFMQEQGLMSSLPIGLNQIGSERIMPSSGLAVLVPFSTRELFQGGEALYYGLNALSSNMIMADRKCLKAPSGLVFGTPGSGKSFAVKREILNVFLITKDEILICDPEGEYHALVEALHGQVIRISTKSDDHINPMDINLDVVYHPEKYRIHGEEEDIDTVIKDKSAFLISFCEIIVKRRDAEGLDGEEESMIDRCVKDIYEEYLYHDPIEEEMPILEDLYDRLMYYADQGYQKAMGIAGALQMYVTGSQNIFNYRTNVDIHNRVVCFDIKQLSMVLRKAGMLIIQNMVWTRVSQNRALKVSTRYYVDEFHLLLSQPQTAAYSVEIWKRFRKWGGIPNGATQNLSEFLYSPQVEDIIGNSDFIYMLNLHKDDREVLAGKLNLSVDQLRYVTDSSAGEGLIKYGDIVIPFRDSYPKGTLTYALMTSKMEETERGMTVEEKKAP